MNRILKLNILDILHWRHFIPTSSLLRTKSTITFIRPKIKDCLTFWSASLSVCMHLCLIRLTKNLHWLLYLVKWKNRYQCQLFIKVKRQRCVLYKGQKKRKWRIPYKGQTTMICTIQRQNVNDMCTKVKQQWKKNVLTNVLIKVKRQCHVPIEFKRQCRVSYKGRR